MRAFNSKTLRRLTCAAAFAAALWMSAGWHSARSAEPDDARPLLLDFYADWCGPCQAVKPAVDSLAREGYAIRRVNIDQDRELAARYEVESIPCFIMLERGREVERIVGAASVERLKLMYRSRNPKTQIPNPQSPLAPHPAWRYERPVGHRAAVVRIYCQDDARTRSIGSGTLVKWNGKTVVLSARHVVKDAKSIVVELHNKRTHRARVVAVDAVWDCAVLELDGEPTGVEPAEVERGPAAIQAAGNRLESCGYGPDGRLACNSGLFLGYKRSTQTPAGPDDWFTISGHARGGDSGGGVFNQQGRLVGVLWGTDGQEVVCVQAGRLHKLLDQAVAQQDATQQKSILQPAPTPASPLLPWRNETKGRDDAQDTRIEALIALQERQARAAAPTPPHVERPIEESNKASVNTDDRASPLLAAVVILASLTVGGVFCSLTKKKAA
jgi:thiol-disulfide isomerase/thioredoxin